MPKEYHYYHFVTYITTNNHLSNQVNKTTIQNLKQVNKKNHPNQNSILMFSLVSSFDSSTSSFGWMFSLVGYGVWEEDATNPKWFINDESLLFVSIISFSCRCNCCFIFHFSFSCRCNCCFISHFSCSCLCNDALRACT